MRKKGEKFDIAKTIEETVSDNPAIQKIIDKLFFKKSMKYGFIMSCLGAGVFSLVNGLITLFNLGPLGWIIFGVILSSIGGVYTVKQWMNGTG